MENGNQINMYFVELKVIGPSGAATPLIILFPSFPIFSTFDLMPNFDKNVSYTRSDPKTNSFTLIDGILASESLRGCISNVRISDSGSPPANLGVFSNGKWTPVQEQCHTTVQERVNEAFGQRFCSGRALKSAFMNGKKIHSTNDFVGGVDFFAVDERVYMNVH